MSPIQTTVYFLKGDIKTCFFYLNDFDLRKSESFKDGICIVCGSKEFVFGSISNTPESEVPNDRIGVAPLFANKLGLRENQIVQILPCRAKSLKTLEIIPKTKDDYLMILQAECKAALEENILGQVYVVGKGQTLPLYVFDNMHIDFEIGTLDLNLQFGSLEKATELIILPPDDQDSAKKEEHKYKGKTEHHLDKIINDLNKSLKKRSRERSAEKNIQEIFKKLQNHCHEKIYEVQPKFMFNYNVEKEVLDKYIILSNFPAEIKTFGPYCTKIYALIKTVGNKIKTHDGTEDNDSDINNEINKNLFVQCYVISFNNGNNMTAICPPNVMKILKIFVGSKISVKKIKPDTNKAVRKNPYTSNPASQEFFWKSMAEIRESIKQTIVNNFKHNFKLNSLIIGCPGAGKTFLMKDLENEFTEEFCYCKFIHCKALRGKKIDTIPKLFNNVLRECAYDDPSILFLDDLDALLYTDDEEGEFNKFYTNHIIDLITDCIQEFQGKYNITVIASTKDMSKLSGFVSTHGPRLFPIIHKIAEITPNERKIILQHILSSCFRIGGISVDFDKIANATNGYTIQDLNDLVDKGIFNCHLRNESHGGELILNDEDFDLALVESIPWNLRGVKLKENVGMKWEDVGGMSKPKEVLTEIFFWPTKYPELLESCPLRLQRGVLLYGAPGTGKTLLAGALASQCGLNFISVKGPEVLSKYVGASEEGVRNLFVQAQRTRPCLLFFDEFDSLAPKRGHDSTGVTDRVVNQLLTQLDGVEALNGVWVLAATSRPDMIDPALLRPGRLDKLVFCDIPNQEDRLSILCALSQKLPKEENVNLSEISRRTDGFTGADLQAVLYNAQMLAIKEKENNFEKENALKVTQGHLLAALQETKPSLSPSEILRYGKIYERFINSRKKKNAEHNTDRQRVTLA